MNETEKNIVRKDEIIYDEGWHDALDADDSTEPVAVDETPDGMGEKSEGETAEKSAKKKPLPALVSIQLALCVLIALAVFFLKALDTDIYRDFSAWYESQMKRTLISQQAFDEADVGRFFKKSAADTATPDEAAGRIAGTEAPADETQDR